MQNHSEWLFWSESPCTLLLVLMGMEDVHVSCWNQNSGMGMIHNEEKTPCPGNSDSAVQSLLCYLPRAIYSHKIFHSVRDMARKSPANPKVLQSYNNHWSTPSTTKGIQQSSCWPTWEKLCAIYSEYKEAGKIRGAHFSRSMAFWHCSGTVKHMWGRNNVNFWLHSQHFIVYEWHVINDLRFSENLFASME